MLLCMSQLFRSSQQRGSLTPPGFHDQQPRVMRKKTRAEARVLTFDRHEGGIEPYSAANAWLNVQLGRMALLALATSGR